MTDLPAGQGPRLRCVRAPNPSPMTGTGTNTWLLGSGDVALIDPGPDMPQHARAILSALDPGERISHVIVTHAHADHSALAPHLAAVTGAPVLAFGTARAGQSAFMHALAATGLAAGGEGVDAAFRPDRQLADGTTLRGRDWTLDVLHTPGHLSNHICLACDGLLFTGDHVMGWSTSLVSPPDGDMGAYMASLARLAGRPWTRLLPGHGAVVDDPAARLAELLAHRRLREDQVLKALQAGHGEVGAITRLIYHDLARALIPAAERNVLAHLLHLQESARATPLDPAFPGKAFLPR